MTHPLREVVRTRHAFGDPSVIAELDKNADPSAGPYLWRYGCKIQSQNGEDGILYYLLQKVGVTDMPTTVEICAGNGIECNSANLILHHGFTSFLFDGNPAEIQEGIKFYTQHAEKDESIFSRVRFANVWVTKDNIAHVMQECQIPTEMDVLITDLDGNDYWILKAIMDSGKYTPRIICVEYQDIIGPERALTIPYDPEFDHRKYDCLGGPNFCGASLQAFIQLLGEKYAFVGCEGLGFNGFFVRRDLIEPSGLTEMTDVTPCFELDKVKFGMTVRWPRTAHLPWVDLDPRDK